VFDYFEVGIIKRFLIMLIIINEKSFIGSIWLVVMFW
jgi:hypothetical protein